MEARRDLGWKGSVHWGFRKTASIENAVALRMRVPRFPGSEIFIEDEDAIPFSIGRFIRFSVVSDGDEFLGAGVFGEEVDSSFFEGVGRPRKRGRKFLARGVGFGEKAFYGPAGFEEFLEEASTFDEKELIFVAIFFLFEGAIALKLGGGEFFHKKINQKINF
jgi:hypothetical protein